MEAPENKKYFISSSLRRRYGYLKGTLNDEQVYTPYKDTDSKFNVITLKDYKQKDSILNTLNLIDLDKRYNSEDIKVTVIMPTYNQANFIIEAVNSILNQKHSNLELIIVDDGSTDNTPEILEALKLNDKRIIAITKTNGGTGSAINRGLKASTGKYCTWVSSDNFYYPEFLETLVDIMEFNINVDYAFSAFEWCNVKSGQKQVLNGFSGVNVPEGIYNKKILQMGYDMGLCFLYRMDLLNQVYFYPQQQGEDYIFSVQCAIVGGDFYNTKKVLGRYNDHDATLSRTKPQETHKAEAIAKELAKKL